MVSALPAQRQICGHDAGCACCVQAGSTRECVLRCSFLEIYNEVLTDLLNPESTHLQIREDVKLGIYVEHLSEHTVTSRESRTLSS